MAKKFNFRLQTLLNLRSEQVKSAKDALNLALRDRYIQENIINSLVEKKNIQLQQRQVETTKAIQMQGVWDYISALEREILTEKKKLAELIKIENNCRKKLNLALKEEKVLLKLREKKIQEHMQIVQREETNFLDEIGTQIYLRK